MGTRARGTSGEGRPRMTALSDRLRRPCRTPGCAREAIRDGAYCSDCTNVLWSTGRPPRGTDGPAWMRHLQVKELTRG